MFKKYTFSLTIILVVAVGFFIITYIQGVIAEIADFDARISNRVTLSRISKPAPIIAKGLYLTAYSASSAKKRSQIIELINETELNSVVIDIKDYSGYILYDSAIPLVNELDTDIDRLDNIHLVIKEFKDAGVYVIARQTVFQDPVLAESKPEWAIKSSNGGTWRDYKGLSWVDPTRTEVWDYNMDIAKEAIKLGFDEINFDYVRFPSDGPIRTAVYSNLPVSKEQTMHEFFQYMNKTLKRQPAYTSIDLFGLVLESHDFDMNIGQRLELAEDLVDYIYPMTYPSHYPNGHLGLSNPADYPYLVISNGLTKAEAVFHGNTKLRPWLQAFNLGAVYDGTKIRAQIDAAEESKLTAGWMLWNAANRYSSAGLAPNSVEL